MSPLVQLAISLAWLFAVPTLLLLAGLRPVGRPRLAAFASQYGVTVTVDNGPFLIGYLARTTRWRAIGGAAGWLTATVLPLPGGSLLGAAVGYLLGALAAEFRTSARLITPAGPRRAALEIRRSKDYVSWVDRWGPALTVVAVVFQAGSYLIWPSRLEAHEVAGAAIAAGGLVMAGLALLMWASRWLVTRRAQPLVSPELSAADDAVRASSLQAIGGVALTLMCLVASGVTWGIAQNLAAPAPFSWVSTLLPYLLVVAAVYARVAGSMRAHRVRRRWAA
ncbi:hypothetical protein [Streptosporangium sp. NPDC000396]|uniref:hypothetical protein n=1 Tax=Streptosporangium sp. NPDC000396 TaxID=3366185 RepID=UPI0036CE0901